MDDRQRPPQQGAGRAFQLRAAAPGRTIYLEPTPKRVRVEVGGEVIADSRNAYILHESGLQPDLLLPAAGRPRRRDDATDRHTHCPKKGDASYYTIRAGGETVENGAWYYPEPLEDAPFLKDLVAFYFDRMGRWLEEGEEIGVHPRDPYHRVDVVSTDRHIRVSLEGELLAETNRALALFESNLPPRWYIPRDDVVAGLEVSDTVTRCPYKGTAGYYSVTLAAETARARTSSGTTTSRWRRSAGSPGCCASSTRRSTSSSTASSQERPESPVESPRAFRGRRRSQLTAWLSRAAADAAERGCGTSPAGWC